MMKKFNQPYDTIITTENLLRSWNAFLMGKKKKKDVIIFQTRLIDNILSLRDDLVLKTYIHGLYHSFNISDPKPRNIHKATVRDRLIHHLIYQELSYFFDTKFIHDSYSCRVGKGMHKALHRFEEFSRKVSLNNTRTCWVLKCDIRKFFASIDHQILKDILAQQIINKDILWLFNVVIDSFNTKGKTSVGLPLGNLTSQLLVNIYMNEFDQFVKRNLKVRNYIRYADDFVILSNSKQYLEKLIPSISSFLDTLKLSLHDKKLFIKTYSSGVDFLGWTHFPHRRILRTSTKRRIFKKIESLESKQESFTSYIGILKHGDTYVLSEKLKILLQNKLIK